MNLRTLSAIAISALALFAAPPALAQSSTENIGGIIESDMAIARGAGGSKVDYAVFGRGSNGGLWWRQHTASGWMDWAQLAPEMKNSPACINMDRRFHCAIVGKDDAVYVIYQGKIDAQKWVGPTYLGGVTTQSPTVKVLYESADIPSLEIIVRGTDGQFFNNISNEHGWTDWSPLGGKLGGAPVCAGTTADSSDPNDDVVLCAFRDKDGVIWASPNTKSGYAVVNSGGMSPGKPSIARYQGKLGWRLFVQGLDGILWYNNYAGGWKGWKSSGIAIGPSPACIGSGGQTICASKAEDNSVTVTTIDNASLK